MRHRVVQKSVTRSVESTEKQVINLLVGEFTNIVQKRSEVTEWEATRAAESLTVNIPVNTRDHSRRIGFWDTLYWVNISTREAEWRETNKIAHWASWCVVSRNISYLESLNKGGYGRKKMHTTFLQSSFQTGSSRSSSYFQIFILIAFLEKVFIENIIITLWINYTVIIIICINNDNAVINKNVEDSQDLILLFKIPVDTQKNFFEFRVCQSVHHHTFNP